MIKRIIALVMIVVLCVPVWASADEESIYAVIATADGGKANLYHLPQKEGTLFSSVANGAQVMIVYEGSTWHKVTVVGTNETGWMKSSELRVTSRGLSASDYEGVLTHTGVISSSDGFAALRWGPDTNYDMIEKLTNGTEVGIFETVGSWYRVRTWEGKIGYAHKTLVKRSSGAPELKLGSVGMVQVSGNAANVYDSGTNGRTRVGYLYSGDLVYYLGMEGEYIQVQSVKTGKAVFIHRSLVTFGGVRKTEGSVSLRYDADFSSDVIRMTGTRQIVKVLATDLRYSRVEYGAHEGYILTNDLNGYGVEGAFVMPAPTPWA